jgi:transposase/heme-degrading monooxygenase HmoA
MVIRVVHARAKKGMRLSYVRLCEELTIPRMREQSGYLNSRICESNERRPDHVVVATLWQDERDIQTFLKRHGAGAEWHSVTTLPWEAEAIANASVSYFDDDYANLLTMWQAVSPYVRRRARSDIMLRLTDEQWDRIAPILNPEVSLPVQRGRPRVNNRLALESVLTVIHAGLFWRQAPPGVSAATIWRRYTLWVQQNMWPQIWRLLLRELDPQTRETWVLNFLDCAHVPMQRSTR